MTLYRFFITVILPLLLLFPATASANALSLNSQDTASHPTLEALKPQVEAAIWKALTENAPTLEGLEKANTRIRWKIPSNRPLPLGATVQQANCFTSTPKIEIAGAGYGIHWPDLDENIGVEGLLLGQQSLESEASFAHWLAQRPQVQSVNVTAAVPA